MKHVVLVGIVALALAVVLMPAAQVSAQTPNAGTALGTVHLATKVMANGMPLAAGTYQVRLTSEQPPPAIGQSPDSERYVEFLRAGKVVGKEDATVVSNTDIGTIAKGKKPAAGSASVEM